MQEEVRNCGCGNNSPLGGIFGGCGCGCGDSTILFFIINLHIFQNLNLF